MSVAHSGAGTMICGSLALFGGALWSIFIVLMTFVLVVFGVEILLTCMVFWMDIFVDTFFVLDLFVQCAFPPCPPLLTCARTTCAYAGMRTHVMRTLAR